MKTQYFGALLFAFLLMSAASAENTAVKVIKPQAFYRQASASPPKEVNAKQLADWLAEQSVVLIDLRGKEYFEREHIRGAINLPVEDLTSERLKALVPNRDARIVVYCTNNFNPTRMVALTTLGYPAVEQLGYSNVYTLEELWRSESCLSAKKSSVQPEQRNISDTGCESLLPMMRAEKH